MTPLYHIAVALTALVLVLNVVSLANPDWTAKSSYITGRNIDRGIGYSFGLIEWCQNYNGPSLLTECNRYSGSVYDREIDAAFTTRLEDMHPWRHACLAMMVISIAGGTLCLVSLIWFYVVDKNAFLFVGFLLALLNVACQLAAVVVWAVKWLEFAPTFDLRKTRGHPSTDHYRPMFIVTVVSCFLSLVAAAMILIVCFKPECCVQKKKETTRYRSNQDLVNNPDGQFYVHEIK